MASPWELVSIEYELRVKGGGRIEASVTPLRFIAGRGALLPPLERLARALPVGQEAHGVLPAAAAFGNETLLPLMEIPLAEFPDGELPVEGRRFVARSLDGAAVRFRVVAVLPGVARVRLIHPLSEIDLEYRIKVLERRAVAEPPPVEARALGIDSTAIRLWDSAPIAIAI